MFRRSIYMKELLAVLCLMASTTCLAQSPGAKILVSVPEGQPAPPIPLDEGSKCAHKGHVEYEVLSGPKSK